MVGLGLAGMILVSPGASAAPVLNPTPVILRAATFAPDSPHHVPVTPDTAPDGALIGKVLGASPEAGGQWQATQQAMHSFTEKLATAAGDRLVGQFVSPGTDVYSPHVRISGSEPCPAVESVAAKAANAVGAVITVEYIDAPPLSVMVTAVEEVAPKLKAQEGVGNMYAQESTSQIVIEVIRGGGDPAKVQAQAEKYFGSAGIPYRIDVTDEYGRVQND